MDFGFRMAFLTMLIVVFTIFVWIAMINGGNDKKKEEKL
jgi:hypothetical protein